MCCGRCQLVRRGWNTQPRKRTKRIAVAARLATTSTASSTARCWLAHQVQRGQRTAGDRECDAEDGESLQLVASDATGAADAECEPTVGGGVGDGGQQQRKKIRGLRAHGMVQR